MKKLISLLLCAAICVGGMTACGGSKQETAPQQTAQTEKTEEKTEEKKEEKTEEKKEEKK